MTAALYASMLTPIQRTAMRHGYAVTLHGSMTRDMDLVAIPWVDDADPLEELVKAICRIHHLIDSRQWSKKPHGRIAIALFFEGFDKYIDLSIMPRLEVKDEN